MNASWNLLLKNEKDGRRGGGGPRTPFRAAVHAALCHRGKCTTLHIRMQWYPPTFGRKVLGSNIRQRSIVLPYIYLQILLAMLRHCVGMFVTVLKGLFNLLWQYELRKIRKCCNFSHSVYRILLKNWFFSSKVWTSLNILIGSILNTNTCFMLVHGECECDVEIHVMVRMKSFN